MGHEFLFFFQLFENVSSILISQAIQDQAEGQLRPQFANPRANTHTSSIIFTLENAQD